MGTDVVIQEKKRGGARAGAGRKRKCVKRLYFSAAQDVLDIVNAVEGNKSDFINDCIRTCYKNIVIQRALGLPEQDI